MMVMGEVTVPVGRGLCALEGLKRSSSSGRRAPLKVGRGLCALEGLKLVLVEVRADRCRGSAAACVP